MTPAPNTLARSLRAFLGEHLPKVRGGSPHTIRSYRDSLMLLLRFVAHTRRRSVDRLDLEHFGVEAVIAFLDHLESERSNSPATRNARLAAIHSFFRFVAAQEPTRLDVAQRILAIPFKRAATRTVEYLEHDELGAILAMVDLSTPRGRRDYTLIATLFNSGARVQELLDIRVRDLELSRPAQVRLMGKGRKERICPLWPQTAKLLRALCRERQLEPRSTAFLFVNQSGDPLTRFGVRYILAKYTRRARAKKPRLGTKRIHPHSIRHSTAVHLLKAGVDLVTISHWLGHASPNTTNRYAKIDIEVKRRAIAKVRPGSTRTTARWRRDTGILDWLESL